MIVIALIAFVLLGATAATAQNQTAALVILPSQDVFSSYPAVDTALPTNGRLVLFGTSAAPDMAFVRMREDGSEDALVHEQLGTGADSTFAVTLEGLVAGELVTVASRCPQCFFVGTWPVIEFVDEAAPTFDDGPTNVEVTPQHESLSPFVTAYNVAFTLPGARDDAGTALVRVAGEGFSGHAEPTVGGSTRISVFFPGGEERTVCMDAVALDRAGNETPFPDGICADLDDGGGCAQTSATPFAAFALLLALARRRSRGRSQQRRRHVARLARRLRERPAACGRGGILRSRADDGSGCAQTGASPFAALALLLALARRSKRLQ